MPLRVLITAGPTQEAIDRVRFISNRSSGRMGIALAQASSECGYHTTLLLGPVTIQSMSDHGLILPDDIATHHFQSTKDLQCQLRSHWPTHDILLMAAAVADFQPIIPEKIDKMRRQESSITLELQPTPDLLTGLAEMTRSEQTVVGFALESTAELERSAQEKLKRKKLDAIVANPLETMDSTNISATVYLKSGKILKAPTDLPKQEFARWLLDHLPEISNS